MLFYNKIFQTILYKIDNQAIQNKKLQDTQYEFKKKQDDLYNYIYTGYSSHGHNYRYNSKSPYTINTNYNNT